MQTAIVEYQIATYSGKIEVSCDENDENEFIIARAKNQLRRDAGGSLPYGYESFKITDRR